MTPVEGPPGLFCPGPRGPVPEGAPAGEPPLAGAVSHRPTPGRFAPTGQTQVAASQGPRRRLSIGTDETATITVYRSNGDARAPHRYHMGFQAINKRGKLSRRNEIARRLRARSNCKPRGVTPATHAGASGLARRNQGGTMAAPTRRAAEGEVPPILSWCGHETSPRNRP